MIASRYASFSVPGVASSLNGGPASKTNFFLPSDQNARSPFANMAERVADITIREAKRLLNDLARLPDNWDGYGGSPIPAETATNAMQFLYGVSWLLGAHAVSAPDITPNPHGTLSLEWFSESAEAYLEVGCTQFSFYIDRNGRSPLFKKGKVTRVAIDEVLALVKQYMFPSYPTVTNTVQPIASAA